MLSQLWLDNWGGDPNSFWNHPILTQLDGTSYALSHLFYFYFYFLFYAFYSYSFLSLSLVSPLKRLVGYLWLISTPASSSIPHFMLSLSFPFSHLFYSFFSFKKFYFLIKRNWVNHLKLYLMNGVRSISATDLVCINYIFNLIHRSTYAIGTNPTITSLL